MKFPELCERLIMEVGSAKVSSNAYLDLGSHYSDGLGLWVHDGVFEVGSEERGEWTTERSFETEDAACEFIHERLTRKQEIWIQTPEERQRSKEITEAYNRKREARREYWRQHGEFPPEDQ